MKNCAAQTASNNQRCSFAMLMDNPKTGGRGWSTGCEIVKKRTVTVRNDRLRAGHKTAARGRAMPAAATQAVPVRSTVPSLRGRIGMRRKNGKGTWPFPFFQGAARSRQLPSSFMFSPTGEAAYRPASSTRRRHISDLLRLYRWMPGAPQSSSCRIWRAAKRRPASRTASTPPSLWAASSSR